MDWLGGWLKTVIIVILLATFVDLLLPSNTMQKYIKTIMSLFILLTLLSPILELFQNKWNLDRMLTAAVEKQGVMDGLAVNGQQGTMTSLEAITQKADKLKAIGEKQSQEMLQTQIAALMKDELQKQTKLLVDKVEVKAKIENNGKPAISHVQVSLHEIETTSGKGTSQAGTSIAVIAPIEPVKPVQIDLVTNQGSSLTPEVKSASTNVDPIWDQEKQKLIQSISSYWMVEKGHITVQIQSSDRN